MEFATQYTPHERVIASSGSSIKELFTPVFDDLGRMRLEKRGEEDFYDFIQSHADSVNIHVLLKRFAQGEVDVLSKVQGFYGDFSQFPKSYAEVLNSVNGAKEYFMALPLEVRATYNHDFNQFLVSLTPESFLRQDDKPVQKAEPAVESEVTDDAS